jgi:hypothetical protein
VATRRHLPQVVRIATVLVFIAVALLVVRLVGETRKSKDPEVAEPTAAAASVSDVIANAQTADVVAVRGFVFDGGGTGPRLCARRKPTTPPLCLGPFLDLSGLPPGLPFRNGRALGRPIRWVDQPVTLYGHVTGTAMAVTDVAR